MSKDSPNARCTTDFPIPDEALDDRQAIVGTAGSGKTYLTLCAEERLLTLGARVVHVDPLGVAWGLRLMADGKTPSPYDVVIFGGDHGDLPINERAGALIGETVATMRESCILDLSGIGTKAGERRFMLGFLTALYRHTNRTPTHLIIDEADMFAPQVMRDKDGEAAKLLGMMETVVRRGRIRGFIPWLITQRPAVLNKDVLSQADGLVALKLTGSHDRDAIGAWIEGQAERSKEKAILASLAGLQRGEGVIWNPGRGVLETVQFPMRQTFDSSRTPSRGEKAVAAELKPIDLGALKERMATVESEARENDPKALKAEIANLQADLRKAKVAAPPPSDPAALSRERVTGFRDGFAKGEAHGRRIGELTENRRIMDALARGIGELDLRDTPIPEARSAPPPVLARVALSPARQSAQARVQPPGDFSLTPAKQKIVDAIAWCEAVQGVDTAADKTVVAFLVGLSSTSGGYANYLSQLRTAGLIDYPQPGAVSLTGDGRAVANAPAVITNAEVQEMTLSKVQPKLREIARLLIDAHPASISKSEIAERVGLSASSGGFANYLSRLRSLKIIDYPAPGEARATDFMFPET